jgi:4-amino-4-deoxy-L-arabinose transferase-like glycosyltransferase
MDTATLTPDASSTAAAPAGGEQRRERRWRPRRPEAGRGDWVYPVALGALLLASLLIRLWGVKQGLPYSYNSDEATHFVPRAVGFLAQDLNPHYFLNPPAYSYLLYIVFELWFGSADAIRTAFTSDPTSVFVVARVLAAVLGTIAVWLTYLTGKRLFDRAVGLLAAGVMAFAFLPVFYSHLALNDVPTLAPVALSLYGVAGVLRFGRRRDYAVAGIGIGLAAATKYTGGITLVCLLAASLCDGLDGSGRSAARRCALALGLALLSFLALNPYAALDPNEFFSGLSQQASQTAGPFKLGSNPGSGIKYYLWTFAWGLGWVPTLAALGGTALLLVRRRLALALVLLPATLAFIVFMGNQQRFFGRWLMPIFPIVALLGAYGAVELARALSLSRGPAPARRLMPAVLAGALVAVAMLGQSVAADVHNDQVLSRPDTRNLARAWMVKNIPAASKVVIEPLVPDDWALDVGKAIPVTPTGERWWRYPTWLTNLDQNLNPLPAGQHQYVFVDQYERYLYPQLLDQYAAQGYCWVVIGSLQAGRAFAQPDAVPQAVSYYADLSRRAKLVYQVSPFARGDHPDRFSFDWSIDYYPDQYWLPGPEIGIYHLTGGRCTT